MGQAQESTSRLIDPIELLLEELDGGLMDNYLIHLCTWSDVVKNDIRKALKRDDDYINKTLHALLRGAIDRNGRYHYHTPKEAGENDHAFSPHYVRVQCLLSEWLCIYRAVAIYTDAQHEFEESAGKGDFEEFEFID